MRQVLPLALVVAVLGAGIVACGAGGAGGGGGASASSSSSQSTPATFSISGTVTSSGTALRGVTVTLSGSRSGTALTDASGTCSFANLANGTYTLTPSRAGYAFSPAADTRTLSGANATGVAFAATLTAASKLPLMRMVSMEGNWGGNVDAIRNIPDAYIQHLKDDHVNWLYISLPIFNATVSDPRVRILYRPADDRNYGNMYSFNDQDLVNAVNKLRQNGITVFFSLMFMQTTSNPASACNTAEYSVDSHLFGDPEPPSAKYGPSFGYACVRPDLWWWNPSHPAHAANVATFWATYTEVAVKYAKLAQQLGVGALAVGEETDRLFRTRSSARFPTHFSSELSRLVSAVRAEYKGAVTYAQNGIVYSEHPEWWGFDTAASSYLFKDLGLDIVGISAYYTLLNGTVDRVYSVAELETLWASIFEKYVVPLQTINPDTPIVFTSVGTTNSVNILSNPLFGMNVPFDYSDANGNGLDDGMEQQRNYYQALINVVKANDYMVRGLDFWGFGIDTDPRIVDLNNAYRNGKLYGRPAELVVRDTYLEWEKIVRWGG